MPELSAGALPKEPLSLPLPYQLQWRRRIPTLGSIRFMPKDATLLQLMTRSEWPISLYNDPTSGYSGRLSLSKQIDEMIDVQVFLF